jgi:hypothetical protein
MITPAPVRRGFLLPEFPYPELINPDGFKLITFDKVQPIISYDLE